MCVSLGASMRSSWLWLIFLAACSTCLGQSYIDYSRAGLPGRLFDPPVDPNDSSPRPLILALHGGGGIGSDNTRHLVDFSGLRAKALERNALLYLPQATTAFWHAADRPAMILEMIDLAIEERNVDADRIYITGFSMGGGGTWDIINLFPERFAAAFPISGIRPRTTMDYAALLEKPIWAFHARDDRVVSATQSRDEINGFVAAANLPAITYPGLSDRTTTFSYFAERNPWRYRELATGGHSIWFNVSSSEEVIDWVFSFSREVSQDPVEVRIDGIEMKGSVIIFTIRSANTENLYIQGSDTLLDWRNIDFLEDIDDTFIQEVVGEASTNASFYRAMAP